MNLKSDILRLREEGKTYNQIVETLGCSKGIVSYHCANLEKPEISTRRLFHSIPTELEDKITELYCVEGMSSKEISEALNLDLKSLLSFVRIKKLKKDSESLTGYSAVIRRYRRIKRLAVEYKGGKCSNCGYSKCLEALDFHHTEPSEKEFTISSSSKKSWQVIKVELDKCVCLCANCHREVHAGITQI